MVNASEPTPWELERRFDRLDESIRDGFRRMDERLEKMVTADVFAVHQRGNEHRLEVISHSVAEVDRRCTSSHKDLDAKIDQVEEKRANDRRVMTKAIIGAVATLAAAVLGFILNLVQGGLL